MKIPVKVYTRSGGRLFIWPEEKRRSRTIFLHMLDRTECSSRQIGIREVSRCMYGGPPTLWPSPLFNSRADGWSLAVGCSSHANAGPTGACRLTQGPTRAKDSPGHKVAD